LLSGIKRLEGLLRDQVALGVPGLGSPLACLRERDDGAAPVLQIWRRAYETLGPQAVNDTFDGGHIHRRQAAKMILRHLTMLRDTDKGRELGWGQIIRNMLLENQRMALACEPEKISDLLIQRVDRLRVILFNRI